MLNLRNMIPLAAPPLRLEGDIGFTLGDVEVIRGRECGQKSEERRKKEWKGKKKERGKAKRVLTQTTGPWKRPVAYLSKKLDSVAAGWSACLHITVGVALLVKDAEKLTLGQALEVCTHMLWNLF